METIDKDKLKSMVPISAPNLDKLFKNKRESDKARAVLQHLFFTKIRMKKDSGFAKGIERNTRYVPISATNLKLIVRNYSQIIKQLIEFNIIEYKVNEKGSKSYLPGKYTMLYRIKESVLASTTQQKYRVEYITHPAVIGAIKRYYERRYDRQLKKVLHQDFWLQSTVDFIDRLYLNITLEQIKQLDSSESNKEIDFDYLIGFVNKFNNKLNKYFVRDTFGNRLHSHVTSIPKLLRPFLKLIDIDEPLVMIDVKSAQPYLMASIFYHNKLIELVEEFKPILPIFEKYRNTIGVRLFYEDCISGNFYTYLMQASDYSKKELKNLLFQHVFYSSTYSHPTNVEVGPERWKIQQLFCGKYRDVFNLLQELKRTPKSTLPFVGQLSKMYVVPNMLAQRLESTIFLDGITKQCAEQDIPVATIHDAWIMKKSDQNRFMELFHLEFSLLSIEPPQVETTKLSATIV